MLFLKPTLIALATLGCIHPIAVTAQSSGATVELNTLTATGVVVGTRVSFGPEYAAKHNIPVPATFSFTVPTDRTKNIKVLNSPGGTGIYKVTFATDDNLVKSNLQLVPFTLGTGTDEERLNGMARIVREAFIASVVNPERADINVMRPTEIRSYAAFEALGRYDGGADGIVALRVVAVIEHGATDGLIAIINALPKNAGMSEVGDILGVDGSRALGTLKFE